MSCDMVKKYLKDEKFEFLDNIEVSVKSDNALVFVFSERLIVV